MSTLEADVVIFGGGVAGLWSLARLLDAGYRAILLESEKLGGVQTLASQGIIHGGTKYALTGKITGSSQAIAEMPSRWTGCLKGDGELDLSEVRVLSPNQFLWSTGNLASNITGFFAGKMMRSRMEPVGSSSIPEPFDHPDFRGNLYRLQEPVLDVHSLVEALVGYVGDHCRRVQPRQLKVDDRDSGVFSVTSEKADLEVRAGNLLFSAGSGNARLLELWQRDRPAMQQRPLHMLMLKGDLPQVYAHCLGASANPRLTITSYLDVDGKTIWYLGGQVAEQGVGREPEEQIARGKAELAELLPWIDFTSCQWSTLPVNRAEPLMPGNKRPDDCFLQQEGRVLTAWPTKLAFAPRLADKVLQALPAPSGKKLDHDMLQGLPFPAIGEPPWREVRQWS